MHWWTKPDILNQLLVDQSSRAQLARDLNDHQMRYSILLTKIRKIRFQLQLLYKDPNVSTDHITNLYAKNLAEPLAQLDHLRMSARTTARDALGPSGLAAVNKRFPRLFAGTWFRKPDKPIMEVRVKP